MSGGAGGQGDDDVDWAPHDGADQMTWVHENLPDSPTDKGENADPDQTKEGCAPGKVAIHLTTRRIQEGVKKANPTTEDKEILEVHLQNFEKHQNELSIQTQKK